MANEKDLVERLREPHGFNDPAGPRMREAADEIQRLRVEIGYLEDIARCRGEENERLRTHEKALRWGAWSWADGRVYPEPPCPTDDEFAAIMRHFGYEPWEAERDSDASVAAS